MKASRVAAGSSNPTLGHASGENSNSKDICSLVFIATLFQDTEATQMSMNR